MIGRKCGGVALVAMVTVAVSCTSDEWPVALDTDSEGASGSSSASAVGALESAHLEVFEPQGASIHMIGESIPLLAELRDDDGLPVDFGDVVWQTEAVGPTLLVGLDGEVVLPPGKHDITAIARLPNGDRLETRVEDVRVQSRWTGRYEGTATLSLEIEFQGFPVPAVCQGPLEFFVDVTGDMVEIVAGTCTLNLVVITVDASYTLTGDFDSGIAGGVISYDLGTLGTVDMPWTGAFIEEGFGGSYEGNVTLPLIGAAPGTGTLALRRTNPFVDEPD